MRLRQLLGVSLALLLCCALGFAAMPQLTNVSVVAQGGSTTVTMHATGSFTHREYRANDKLLLVDLTGVNAGKLQDRDRKLEVPGVQSYHVVAYKGMGSVDVARIELRLTSGATFSVNDTADGLAVTITPAGADASSASAVPVSKASLAQVPPKSMPVASEKSDSSRSGSAVVKVQRVSVLRGKDGMEIEVVGSGPLSGKSMKLAAPDRVVLDISNAVPAGRPKPIPVNANEIKEVRIARFQAAPPVTRIVVDLKSPHDFEVAEAGNKLVLKLKSEVAASGTHTATTPVRQAKLVPVVAKEVVPDPHPVAAASDVATNAQSAVPDPAVASAVSANQVGKEAKGDVQEGKQAQPVVFVEPTYQAKTDQTQTTAPAQQSPVAPATQPAASASAAAAVNMAQEQLQKKDDGVAQKPRYTGEPVSVNLKDVDLKDFFRLIHEISGLNVVLDPSVNGTLTLVLDDVPWDQALDIVLKNNGLDKSLDGNVLRIATVESFRKEAQERRLQAEAQALAVDKVNVTRFLSYAHAKDVLPTVKRLLSTRGDVVADERTNALIIQDIPKVIPDIDRLLAQLDRKTQEVEIEARVVAATRTFARDIGTQIGFGTGSSSWAVGGVQAVGNSPIIANNPTHPNYFLNDTNQVPLFSNLAPTSATSGIQFSNATNAYRIDLVLSAAESRGLLKVLSRPRVVTQNNVQAIVKQGFRVPVVTMGQLGGPPSVTYIEAVLRLTVTPQITVENTIFLNVDIENTSPDFSRTVLGNPVFLTQQATTQVLVTDGGTVLIGGVIQTQNSVNVSQVPLLGDIPVLGNLFKHRNVQNNTQELIFILTPKIVQT
jgi:type IV pilus assembly protein PilQ